MLQILASSLTKCRGLDDLTPIGLMYQVYKHDYVHGFTIYKITLTVPFTFCHYTGINCKCHKLARHIKLGPTALYKTVLFHPMGHERLTEPVSV